MLTDPARRPLPLDAALQVVTTEVRLNHTDNHWNGGLCHSALERLSTALGLDFGSLAVRYQVSKPNWAYERDVLFPWQGTQEWYLSKTRLVGLVALEALADETRAAVHGRIRLGMKRGLEALGGSSFKYGGLSIKVHAHNYAKITSQPSETFYLDKPENYRSTEITLVDPLSAAAGGQGKRAEGKDAQVKYPKGTRYWFLVEVRPADSPAAEGVERIERGALAGFRFREPGREVVVLHNPTDQPAQADVPLEVPAGAAVTIYQDRDGKGRKSEGAALRTELGPHRHVVAVGE